MNKWIKGTNATVLSVAVIGIFIIATLFLNSMKGIQWDLSANKKYSLSEQTIQTLNKLDQDIKITFFTGGMSADEAIMYRDIRDMLTEFQKRNSKLKFEEVDPNRDPAKAQQYAINQAGTIVFELGAQKKEIYGYQLFGPASSQGGYAFNGEEKFTQAIISLTSGEKHPVYFLTGHNEMPLAQMTVLRSSLEGENYEVKELNLFKEGAIPENAEAIFIVGPQTDLNEKEVALLKEYSAKTGKLFVALGYAKEMQNRPQMVDLLKSMNVVDTGALVVETGRSILNDPFTIVPELGFHEITNSLANQGLFTIFPLAQALATDKNNTEMRAHPLLTSSDKSYGETNLEELTAGQPKQGDGDLQGPMDLAYAVMDKDGKPKGVVIGNSQFLNDQIVLQQGNRDFVLNSVNWLQEQKDQITIRPREENPLQQAVIMPNQRSMIFYTTIVVYPLLIIALGIFIWWRRRKG